jgi:amidase
VRAGIADAARREPAGVQDLFGDEIREISQAYFDPSGETSAAATRALVGYRARIGELFADADYILTPCVTGEAPSGLAWTGDPIFCQPWSALGLPAISIPVGVGKNGLPVGIQIVGKLNRDYELLSFARDLASDTWYSCQLK